MNQLSTPQSADEVAAAFEQLRPRLIGMAYGLVGTLAEAEDAVQEAWIRLQRSDVEAIDDLTGWLLTTTSRIAIDVLRSARVRRESYVGPWLPEPIETAADPADSVSLRRPWNRSRVPTTSRSSSPRRSEAPTSCRPGSP